MYTKARKEVSIQATLEDGAGEGGAGDMVRCRQQTRKCNKLLIIIIRCWRS